MRVSELYPPSGPFVGESVVIVGLGPSLKCFAPGFFHGKICLFLNDAYTVVPPTDAPAIAFQNHDSFSPIPDWIEYRIRRGRFGHYQGKERDDNMTPWDSKDFHVFSYRDHRFDDGRSLHDLERLWLEPDHYWCNRGGTVAVFALQFAALAGFREIYLVGCDCTELGKRHYASSRIEEDRAQRLRARPGGLEARNYEAYREGLEILQREIWKKYGTPVVTLSPFMGLGREKDQFQKFEIYR